MRALTLAALGLLAAAPAAAEWAFRPQGPNASVSAGNRTLVVSCDGGTATLSMAPGPQQLDAATAVPFGFVVDGNDGARVNVPFSCTAAGCIQAEAPRRYTGEDSEAVMAALRRGDTLEVWFRERVVATFTLDGSSAALSSLDAAPGACAGL